MIQTFFCPFKCPEDLSWNAEKAEKECSHCLRWERKAQSTDPRSVILNRLFTKEELA